MWSRVNPRFKSNLTMIVNYSNFADSPSSLRRDDSPKDSTGNGISTLQYSPTLPEEIQFGSNPQNGRLSLSFVIWTSLQHATIFLIAITPVLLLIITAITPSWWNSSSYAHINHSPTAIMMDPSRCLSIRHSTYGGPVASSRSIYSGDT